MDSAVERRTFALQIEYDGTEYGGSQFQINARTIQGELERALERVSGERRRVGFAGRTDAGVHAGAQVVTVRVPAKWNAAALSRALNAKLPEDVAVVGATAVSEEFDPRRCAVSRRYRYQILNRKVRSPLLRRSCWLVPYTVNEEAVRAAAALLIGEHDFAAFAGPVKPAGASTVRRLSAVDVGREGPLLLLEFTGNAFLAHQVRRMVGTLVEVGRGRLSIDEFSGLLRRAEPGAAGPAAPAHGLCLVGVTYEDLAFGVGEGMGEIGG